MTNKTECKSYTLDNLRNAFKSFEQIEAEIHALIVSNAKDLIDGKAIDISDLARSYRAYEMVQERHERAVQSYEAHQERCRCEIPADMEEMF
jgi:hypothetical protein